jgi:hypothetical protein
MGVECEKFMLKPLLEASSAGLAAQASKIGQNHDVSLSQLQ